MECWNELEENRNIYLSPQVDKQGVKMLKFRISGFVCIHRKSRKMLNVRVDSRVKCELGKKAYNLTVKNGPGNSAMTFKKVGNNDLTLLWPESG